MALELTGLSSSHVLESFANFCGCCWFGVSSPERSGRRTEILGALEEARASWRRRGRPVVQSGSLASCLPSVQPALQTAVSAQGGDRRVLGAVTRAGVSTGVSPHLWRGVLRSQSPLLTTVRRYPRF